MFRSVLDHLQLAGKRSDGIREEDQVLGVVGPAVPVPRRELTLFTRGFKGQGKGRGKGGV